MVDKDDVVKLIGFRSRRSRYSRNPQTGKPHGLGQLHGGGTPQAAAHRHKIDIYSFGVTRFETFCGKLPMEMLTVSYDTMLKHLNAPGARTSRIAAGFVR